MALPAINNALKLTLLGSLTFVLSACDNGNQTPTETTKNATEQKTETKDNQTKGEQPGTPDTPKDGGNLIIAVQDDPRVMNALYANDRVTLTINQSLNSPLFFMEPDGSKAFVLAESITPSADYLTYTLKLRDGIKWHDGTPITADDIVFTMESILDENQNSSKRFYFVYNDTPLTVKKIDDRTVEYTLPEPSAAFEAMLALSFPIPAHIFKGEANIEKSAKNNQPIGSGPFKFAEYRPGEYVKLDRFDDYFAGKAHLDSVIYRIAKDPNTSNIALQNGELNMRKIDTVDYEKLNNTGKFNMVVYPEGRLNYMVFNLNNPDLQNKAMRQAIAYAIDKNEMLTVAYDSLDFAPPATSIFTPDTLYHSAEHEQYGYNLEKAKALVAESGIQNPTFKMAYINTIKYHEAQAIYLQQKLKDINVNIELMPIDQAAFGTMSLDPNNKAYDISFGGYVMGIEPDAYKTLYLSNAPYNYSHYKNPDLDKLWQQAATQLDKPKRAELYKQIQNQFADEMTVYPITFDQAVIAVDKKFGGLEEAQPKPVYLFRDLSKIYLKE